MRTLGRMPWMAAFAAMTGGKGIIADKRGHRAGEAADQGIRRALRTTLDGRVKPGHDVRKS